MTTQFIFSRGAAKRKRAWRLAVLHRTLTLFLAYPFCWGCVASQDGGAPANPSLSNPALPTHWPLYAIGFHNNTGGELHDVRLEWPVAGKTYRLSAGILSPEAGKFDGGAPDPIPVGGTVFWTTADNVQHQQYVVIAATVKNQRAFDGTIYLRIDKSGVAVRPVTQAESDAGLDAGLIPPP